MFFQDKTVGVLGCGNLGFSMVNILLRHHPEIKSKLLLSHAGSPTTYHKIKSLNLETNIVSNIELLNSSEIIIMAIRPQQINELESLKLSDEKLMISLMAGISCKKITSIFMTDNVVRVMLSMPETNEANIGIAGVYGKDMEKANQIKDFFSKLVSQGYLLNHEDSINVFTVLVNLPYLLSIKPSEKYHEEIYRYISKKFESEPNIDVRKIFDWGMSAKNYCENNHLFRSEFIQQTATQNGVLQAMLIKNEQTRSAVELFDIGIQKINELCL